MLCYIIACYIIQSPPKKVPLGPRHRRARASREGGTHNNAYR